jgi:hypothetical protein
MFENAKVGDQVWSITRGWGRIIEINDDEADNYPISVKFECANEPQSYTLTGKYLKEDLLPAIYWNEVGLTIPDSAKCRPIIYIQVGTEKFTEDFLRTAIETHRKRNDC